MLKLQFVVAGLAAAVSALSVANFASQQALVLYDPQLHAPNASDSSPVATFIADLQAKYTVTLKPYDESNHSLAYDGAPRYDHLVLLPSAKKAVAKDVLDQHKLLDFINGGSNVVVVGSVAAVLPDAVRLFLNEVGIYPAPKNFQVVDHFDSSADVELSTANVVEGNGVVAQLDNQQYVGSAALISNNEYIVPILRASKTAVTVNPEAASVEQDATWTFGEQGFFAVGLQSLNNARLTWLGAESLLQQPELVDWAFQNRNVLKLQFVHHYNNDSPADINPTLYRINHQAIYTVGVSELVNGQWVPYVVADDDDKLQLAFKMLDPYHRLNLESLGPAASVADSANLDTQVYYANFTVPDHHGMFTFELDYKRSGWSFLADSKIVTVRHLANDEYKRSWDITNSWVYIASAATVVVAWFLFVVNYIYVGNTPATKKNV